MAKKYLGQHFLSDPRILSRIAAALPAEPGDAVLEIGPGKGALTAALIERGLEVTAIERDRDLIPLLRSRWPALTLVQGDALEVDWAALMSAATRTRWFVAGNIPYNITSPLIDQALTVRPLPAAIVFLVQKEVALRLAAGPGTSDYGALSVGAQSTALVERLFTVPAGAFHPPPKVDSAVVRLTPRPVADRPADQAGFRRMVVGLFASRRKQLGRAVRTLLGCDAASAEHLLAETGLDSTRRAETLSVAEFRQLHQRMIDGGLGDRLTL
ncbi:MAG: ribosomal RNA small subunit methyltransferase A [Gemmatimonadales bacterium]|nr:ribosomal RNA small subunit methyltransferase A [Gemmatimonadales bacterium]